MIKNDRQYRITKAKAKKFTLSLQELTSQPSRKDMHPLLAKAQLESLKSQYEELEEDLKIYTELKSGKHKRFKIDSFEELPNVLIQTRIARGLTQKALSELLNLKEQQIQRYESTNYATASFSRLKKIIDVLDIKLGSKVVLENSNVTLNKLYNRLKSVGLNKDIIVDKLLPNYLSTPIKENKFKDPNEEKSFARKAASVICTIFKWSPNDVFGTVSLDTNIDNLAAIHFKLKKQKSLKKISAYTYYTIVLTQYLLEATRNLSPRDIPKDPNIIRKEIIQKYSAINFENALRYIWNLGIPVLPLNDSGYFHAACFRFKCRNVIILKQKTKFESRWLFDLMHELAHAKQKKGKEDFVIIEDIEIIRNLKSSDEEDANKFAGDVLLDCRAEELAYECIKQAKENLRHLKLAVTKVAKKEKFSIGILANYLAFRLAMQGENWWGTANNLQGDGEKPWNIARDILLEHTDFNYLNDIDKNILFRALSE